MCFLVEGGVGIRVHVSWVYTFMDGSSGYHGSWVGGEVGNGEDMTPLRIRSCFFSLTLGPVCGTGRGG